MRFIHGVTAILLCFILFGLVPLVGAEETGTDDEMFSGDENALFSGMDLGSLGLESLLSEELISGIIGFLLSLFLELFGMSLS